ncbi:chitinase [Ganoderma leucocontextum]|nr:chitinase [Ganoderma leucocontextum]
MSYTLVFPSLQRRNVAIPSGPKFVIYSASAVGEEVLPPVDQMKGFNVVNLAFLQYDGAHDQALNWANLLAPRRQQLKAQYNDAGISFLVTAFGAVDLPTTNGWDPTATADTMAQFVLNKNLDGDYEELQLKLSKPGAGEAWVSTLTQALRTHLPKGQSILTHAPVGPWFEPNFCPGGCYLTVYKNVGDLIDCAHYNVQFYNCHPGYEDRNTLFRSAGGSCIPAEKIVIGKPGSAQDTTNGGFMDPTVLSTCVSQAVQEGWDGGVMVYQYPHANATWIAAVKRARSVLEQRWSRSSSPCIPHYRN